ncbi:oligosaccharide flippase family protein [Vibrio sp. DNB22_10_4]
MPVVKDAVIYLSGEIVTKALPFIIIPYLSRSLGPEGMGELSYFLAMIAVMQTIVSSSFGNAIMRFYYTKGNHAVGLLIQSSILHSILVSVIVFCVLVSFINFEQAVLISATSFLSGLLLTLVTVFQCQKKPKAYVLVQAISSLAITLLTILFFEVFSKTVDFRIYSILIGNLAAIFFVAYLLVTSVRFKLPTLRSLSSAWKYMFILGLPLLFHQLFGVAKVHFERLIIYDLYSEAELGVYFSSWQLAFVFQVVLLAVNKAVTPYVFEFLNRNKLSNSQLVVWGWWLLIPSIVIALPVFFVPDEVYTWVLGTGFGSAERYFPPFVLSMMIMIPYYVVGTLMMYHGDNTRLTAFTLISSLLHVVLVFYFAQMSISYLSWVSVASNGFLSVSLLTYGYFYYVKS